MPGDADRRSGPDAERAAARSRTSRWRTARSTRSTRSRSRWAPASASADTMALISSKLTNIIPWSGCALFLQQPDGETAEVPLRGRRRRAAAARTCRSQAGAGPVGLGGAATAARWSTPTRASRSRRPASPATAAEVGDRLPAVLQRRDVHRLPGALSHRAEPLHRGSSPPARARRRAGRPRHPQLDRLRADAGRLADRSADGAAEPPLAVRRTCRASWRAPSGSRARSALHRHGHRRVQDDQRHLRPPRRRPRAARGGRRAAERRCGRTTSASATPATSSSSCWRIARARWPKRKRRELQERIGEIELEVRPGKRSRWRRAPARRCFRTTASNYEALLADADHRMYRDKAHRRRGRTRQPAPEAQAEFPSVPPGFERETTVPLPTSIS